MRIVETDNFGRDFPDEKFLNLPPMPELNALEVAAVINAAFSSMHPRFWRAVPDDYKLRPGFEP